MPKHYTISFILRDETSDLPDRLSEVLEELHESENYLYSKSMSTVPYFSLDSGRSGTTISSPSSIAPDGTLAKCPNCNMSFPLTDLEELKEFLEFRKQKQEE